MSSTPDRDIVEPSSEPERNLHRRLRQRYQTIAGAIAADRGVDDTFHGVDRTDAFYEEGTMADPERSISDHGKPSLDGLASCIARPTIQANNFEIKPTISRSSRVFFRFFNTPHSLMVGTPKIPMLTFRSFSISAPHSVSMAFLTMRFVFVYSRSHSAIEPPLGSHRSLLVPSPHGTN